MGFLNEFIKGLQCKWDPKLMKNQIREIKLRGKHNYINNPTDKRIVLFERVRESNKIGKFFT